MMATGGTSTGSTRTGSTMTATDGTMKGGTTEVVWRPSAEYSNVAMVAVVANKATAEGGWVTGWWGGGGDCSDSHRGVKRSSFDLIEDHLSTGESWSNTSLNNDGGGGGGGGGRGGGRPLLSVGGTVPLICAHP